MIQENYLEKVYAGFLGMNIGIRLGAPLEPSVWTEDSILKTYGTIKNYIKEYKNFAADDDVNGPVYFLRALYDAKERPITAKDVGDAWLNYTRDNLGMFWWGGYGISTEHTAYLNLKHGINAPESGSIKQNGKIIAEQIGGQIFIDTWGLVSPYDPKKAADYGELAASVSHDGDGINGARFMCACIAKAFEAESILQIIEAGLEQIPKESNYYKVSQSVLQFYLEDPHDFRACFKMLEENWGYDKFGGICHIIPNAGVCVLAMLYGEGDFSKTIEIAVMCGWDTDCNAGNVGTILGVFGGIEALPDHYRNPINDGVVLSGISGYLNILDIPSYAKEIAVLGYKLNGQDIPNTLRQTFGEIHFDFSLPGSTHNFRVSEPHICGTSYSKDKSMDGLGSLKILIDGIGMEEQCRVFYKPFYGKEDFSDERYSPIFSPTAYPGQLVSMKLLVERCSGSQVGIIPYVRTFSDKRILRLGHKQYEENCWFDLEIAIPDTEGDMIDEVGFMLEGVEFSREKTYGNIYLNEFNIGGKSCYSIDINKQKQELNTVTPFSVDGGYWEKRDKYLHAISYESAFAYGGNYFEKDYTITANIKPLQGHSHLLLARAKGAMMGYAAGFAKDGRVCLYKNDFGYDILKEAYYPWVEDKEYQLSFQVFEDRLSLFINDELILETKDDHYEYGMYGCGLISSGRTYFYDFLIKTL
ncbi:ADP-ribosylglycohydrolase family protein [Brassicibacter mesophilus]|uniref:ADP-ribosylglycohydrolase family protein n=1 Tax=Brassicibacter mesophilus TaxID=745119 RepID=UPI003D1F5643